MKLELQDVTNLESTSLVAALNSNFAAIEAALENTLSRDGTSPNELDADLDLDGNRIYNLPDPLTAGEPATQASVLVALEGAGILSGNDGWSPVLSVVNDSARRVFKVVDWTGGEGTKPAINLYVGATGLVVSITDGVDIRGPSGVGTGDLLSTNNLSDLANAGTSRTNLGVPAISHTHLVADLSDANANGRTLIQSAYSTMRTLLGLGNLATKNDTDLVYTGSSSSNVTFPIGAYVTSFVSVAPALGAAATIRLVNASGGTSFTTGGAQAILTGTWRSHGYVGFDSGFGASAYLFQRTA